MLFSPRTQLSLVLFSLNLFQCRGSQWKDDCTSNKLHIKKWLHQPVGMPMCHGIEKAMPMVPQLDICLTFMAFDEAFCIEYNHLYLLVAV